jgi:hypothetical protein
LINVIRLYNSCQGFRKGIEKLNIPKVVGIKRWIFIVMIWVVLILALVAVEKKKL